MKFNMAKCEMYTLSILKVLLAPVKSIVLASLWLITNCCYAILLKNDTFEVI